MGEKTYSCNHCKNLFKLPLVCSITPEKKEIKCPKCGSFNIDEMPFWGPMNFTEPLLMWEYECQECHHTFKLPVPNSPSQEKEIKCPECGGGHIHRLTKIGGEPLYCG